MCLIDPRSKMFYDKRLKDIVGMSSVLVEDIGLICIDFSGGFLRNMPLRLILCQKGFIFLFAYRTAVALGVPSAKKISAQQIPCVPLLQSY